MKYFSFSPIKGFWFTKDLVYYIKNNIDKEKIRISLDLGLTWNYAIISSKKYILRINNYEIDLNKLFKKVLKDNFIYFYDISSLEIYPIYISARNFYKLKPVNWYKAPTLEINGIHMHNISNTTPWEDSYRKIRELKVSKNDKILDICTGLGYTAILSSFRGKEVVTIEKDINVLKIAEYNPWSHNLASEKIKIILENAFDALDIFSINEFNKVIHDPPRFSLAGELYSKTFYEKIYRVLKKGGNLFHYTGSPGKHRGRNIQKGIIKRLKITGFEIIKILKDYGILAKKI